MFHKAKVALGQKSSDGNLVKDDAIIDIYEVNEVESITYEDIKKAFTLAFVLDNTEEG